MSMQTSLPAVYMRGGTSKGVFLHAADLPPAGPARDDLLLRLMGSPDPLQIDGMGGTFSSTSKVIVVEPGPADAVTYWFAQIGVDTAIVDWSGNCGNLTSAVGPFAIDEGLVPATGGRTTVRLINGNTGVEIHADVRTEGGRAVTTGDHRIAGVPGHGSPVITRYLDPAGGVLGDLLPFGAPTVDLRTGAGSVPVSLVDAAHPNLFVPASAVGIAGDEQTVAELNADADLLARVEEIRGAAAVRAGRAADVATASADAPAVPRVMLVDRPTSAEADLRVIAFSMGRVHRGLPMTGALCLAAAAATPGTVVADLLGGVREGLRIQHALGVSEAVVQTRPGDRPIASLGVVRTARRLMDGRVYPRATG